MVCISLGSSDVIDIKIPKNIFKKVVLHFINENEKKSWLLIECLFLHFKRPAGFERNIISLKQAFEHATSEQFVAILIEPFHKELDSSCVALIEKALDKNWIDICSKIICQRHKSLQRREPSIVLTTKLSVKTGNNEIFTKSC